MNKELYHYVVLGMKWGVRKYLETKSYKMFNESIVNTKNKGAINQYYKTIKKHGYDAILDINDINRGYKTEQPVIIFDPSERLKSTKPIELTQTEIDRALKEYDELSRR